MAPNELVPERFWMVMVEDRDRPRLVRYICLNDARLAAERLAVLPENIGKKVWVLEASSYAEVSIRPVTWTYYK